MPKSINSPIDERKNIMKRIVAVISVLAIMFAFAACGAKNNAATTAPAAAGNSQTNSANNAENTNAVITITDLPGDYSAMGNKDDYVYAFYFETVNKAGDTKKYEIYTSEANLADALKNIGVIDLKDDGTVKSVWGEEHNYEKTGYAWLVYADGELIEGALDKVAIENGSNYLFRVETF